jgi:3-hydroxybutyryl-CoA dehydratase
VTAEPVLDGPIMANGVVAAVGTSLPPYTLAAVEPGNMKIWAGILRDPNPIHLDPQAVRAKGLGDKVINQGPANLAYLITMLQRAFPGSVLESLDVRYAGMVYGGDPVEAGGSIRDVAITGIGSRVTCDVWLRANGRDAVITGTSLVYLASLGGA